MYMAENWCCYCGHPCEVDGCDCDTAKRLDALLAELTSLQLRRIQAQYSRDWKAVQIITQRCVRIRREINEIIGG